MTPEVLFEDNHLLVVCKPAGMLSQKDRPEAQSLVEWAKHYRKTRENKPGNVYLGLVHRLDRPVSGIVVLAKTSKAAARLSASFRNNEVTKRYWGIVEGPWAGPMHGEWTDPLAADERLGRVVVVGPESGGKTAHTHWQVRQRLGPLTWLQLCPKTGRKHQLRCQCASHGHPLVGDRRYGSTTRLGDWLALHAAFLSFPHPTREEMVCVRAPVPVNWRRWRFAFSDFADGDK